MVVATAALIKQVNSAFTPSQILQIMKDSGHLIQLGGKHTPQYPLLDVDAALKLAVERAKPFRVHRRAIAKAAAQKATPAAVIAKPASVFNSETVIDSRWALDD